MPVVDASGNMWVSCWSFHRTQPVGNGKRRNGSLSTSQDSRATWGSPNIREDHGDGVARGVCERESRLLGEVPQECIPRSEVGPDGPRDLCKWNKAFWRALVHGKRACQVRGKAVGNVPSKGTRWPPILHRNRVRVS